MHAKGNLPLRFELAGGVRKGTNKRTDWHLFASEEGFYFLNILFFAYLHGKNNNIFTAYKSVFFVEFLYGRMRGKFGEGPDINMLATRNMRSGTF